MSSSPELRSALGTLVNAAIGVGLGVSVLGAAFVVSQFAAGQGSIAGSAPTSAAGVLASAQRVAAAPTPPPPPPTSAAAAPSVTPSARPTDPPSTSTPTPAPTPGFGIAPYTSGGKRYAALSAPVGYIFTAPFAGSVQVKLYQLIDGQVRIGSNVPALPFFPYVTIESADRRVIYRPGAMNGDTQLLVKDGDRADAGSPLFKTIGDGASSWRTFYDRGVTATVIASVAALPTGAELDPVAFFTTR